MNKKKLLLLLPVIALASCAKTERLYTLNQYNSPVFDENYYTEWEGVDKLNAVESVTYELTPYSSMANEIVIGGVVNKDYTWGGDETKQFGYNNNLSKIEKKFNYGVTSKLFDGRVRCEGYFQKSRVQLDKTGFAMFFPKALKATKYLGFACRGGTNYPEGQEFAYSDNAGSNSTIRNPGLKINVEWSFYIHKSSNEYKKTTYKLNNVSIPVDAGGSTTFVNFLPYFDEYELYDSTAMSFTWSAPDIANKIAEENASGIHTHDDLVDDYSQKEKHHMALMMYEVFIGDSIWG